MYEKLRNLHQNRISCYEFSNIKLQYPLIMRTEQTLSNNTSSISFVCKQCNIESKHLHNTIHPHSTLSCKDCVKKALNGRAIDLYDCYNLDRRSLHRLINKTYGYSCAFDFIKEKQESASYEDLPHGNRLHLPLLQLLIKYYGIAYHRGDAWNYTVPYVRLGTNPILLDQIDIEVLPLFGDNWESYMIEYEIEHENEINELVKLTHNTLPMINKVSSPVTITYTQQEAVYHMYHGKITVDLTNLRNHLAEYFYDLGNSQQKAQTMKTKMEPYKTKLRNICNQFSLDSNALKQEWARWFTEKKDSNLLAQQRAEFIIQLPIRSA